MWCLSRRTGQQRCTEIEMKESLLKVRTGISPMAENLHWLAWAAQQESWSLCLAEAAGHLGGPGLDWLAVPTTATYKMVPVFMADLGHHCNTSNKHSDPTLGPSLVTPHCIALSCLPRLTHKNMGLTWSGRI